MRGMEDCEFCVLCCAVSIFFSLETTRAAAEC